MFTLPELRYPYDALEPYIDALTMEIHHSRHHKAYTDNLNNALGGNPDGKSIEEILKNITQYPSAIRNNGGGYYNHCLFWEIMGPSSEGKMGGEPVGSLADEIKKIWGSFEQFKSEFSKAAMGVFGSGWAWLVIREDGMLTISTTPNQDNPLMDLAPVRGIPILGLDVWEHAYYLKYQNRRADYIAAWWNVVNWYEVNKRWEQARK